MVDTLPNPFRDEIKGIAAVSGVPLGKIDEIREKNKHIFQKQRKESQADFYIFL